MAGVLALNVLFLVLAGLFLHSSRQHHQTAAQVRLEDLALEVERDIASAYDQADLLLQGLTEHYTDLTRSGRLDEAAWEHALARARKRLPTLLVLRATDAAGLIQHGRGDAPGERLDVSSYPDFQRLRDDPDAGLQISQPIRGKSSRFKTTYGIVLARRLTDAQGRFAGITRAVFALDHFAELFKPLRVGEHGFVSIRDDARRLVLRQPPLAGDAGAIGASTVSDEWRQAQAAHPHSGLYRTSRASALDGVARLHAYRWNGKHRFFVNLGLSLAEIEQPWWQEVWRTLGLASLFAAMSALMGFWLTGAWRRQQVAVALAEQRQHELLQQKNLLKDVFDTATVAIFTIDAQGVITHANPCMASMFGCTVDQLIGSLYFDRIAHEERSIARHNLQSLLAGQAGAIDFERVYCRQDGQHFLGHLTGKRDGDATNPDVAMVGVIMDIDARRRTEEALRQSEQNFRTLIEQLPIGTKLVNPDGSFDYMNPAWPHLLGYKPTDLPNLQAWWSLAYPDPAYRETVMREWENAAVAAECHGVVARTFRVRCGNGEDKIIEFVTVKLPSRQIVVTIRDVTLDKLHEQQLERIAHYDALTHLPNRLLLADRLMQDMARARRSGKLLAVCYLDLDGFKPVNDTYGHDVGDSLLIDIARRLERCVRDSDTVARVGGDEFVLLLTVDDLSECEPTLTRAIEAIAQPVHISAVRISVSASLGYTVFPLDNSESAALLEHADQAMYTAKGAGKNRLSRYAWQFLNQP